MVTSKFIKSFFPFGKDIEQEFGRFSSVISIHTIKDPEKTADKVSVTHTH